MAANGRGGRGVSPAVPWLICGALKGGVQHGDTEGTENGIGKTAHAWFNSVLTQRREDAKNCTCWGDGWGGGQASPGVVRGMAWAWKAGVSADFADYADFVRAMRRVGCLGRTNGRAGWPGRQGATQGREDAKIGSRAGVAQAVLAAPITALQVFVYEDTRSDTKTSFRSRTAAEAWCKAKTRPQGCRPQGCGLAWKTGVHREGRRGRRGVGTRREACRGRYHETAAPERRALVRRREGRIRSRS